MMPGVGHHQYRDLMERIWLLLRGLKLSTSNAMTGGQLSMHSTRLKNWLRLRQLCVSKKR